MYIADILDGYEELQDLHEYSLLEQEGEDLFNSLQRGIETYQNLAVIEKYHRAHGVTEDFRELIGEEGIVKSAFGAIGRFGKWIVQKIRDMIHWIVHVIAKVFITITSWFSTKLQFNKTIRVPYNISNTEGCINRVFTVYSRGYFYASSDNAMDDILDGIRSSFTENIEELTTALTPIAEEADYHEYTRKEILEHAVRVQGILTGAKKELGFAVHGLDAVTAIVEKMPNSTAEEDYKASQILFKVLREIAFCEQFCSIPDAVESKPFTETIPWMLKCLQVGVSYFQGIGRKVISYMGDLRKRYDNTKFAIHMSFPYDAGLRERLRQFYGGGKFTPGNVIVTNVNTFTWPAIYKNDKNDNLKPSYIAGWCYADDTWSTYKPDLWVNLTALRSKLMRMLAITDTNGAWGKVPYLLKVIVHESRHLYDFQNGIPFDEVKPGASNKVYRKYQHEQRAFNAEHKYVLTNQDLAWGKSILDQVEQEAKRQQQDKQVIQGR